VNFAKGEKIVHFRESYALFPPPSFPGSTSSWSPSLPSLFQPRPLPSTPPCTPGSLGSKYPTEDGHPPEDKRDGPKRKEKAEYPLGPEPNMEWITSPTRGDVKKIEALLLQEDETRIYEHSINRLRRAVKMEAPPKPRVSLPGGSGGEEAAGPGPGSSQQGQEEGGAALASAAGTPGPTPAKEERATGGTGKKRGRSPAAGPEGGTGETPPSRKRRPPAGANQPPPPPPPVLVSADA
jgi:hypothetical protein